MNCAYCNALVKKDRKSIFPVDAVQFCSEKCLIDHIKSMKGSSKAVKDLLSTRANVNSDDFGNRDCYSVSLGMGFRSWFECHVAEELSLNKNLTLFYEPHKIEIDDIHTYIPDFWLPRYGVWLEVKGEWRNGGKKKFCQALDIIGPDRLILIPPLYKNWFRPRKRS